MQPHDDNRENPAAPTSRQDGDALLHFAPGTGEKIKKRAIYFAVLLICAFCVVRFFSWRHDSAVAMESASTADAPISVDVAKAVAAPATETFTLPGETQAWYETTLYARVDGYIADWSADIGDHVVKGQTLATIDTPDLDDQLAASKAKLASSQAKVKVVEANAAFAKSSFQRWWQSPKGVVSDQERQEKKAQYDGSLAQLTSANAEVTVDQAGIDRLTALSQFKAVTAPFDATVTARRIDIGDLVTAGSTANTTSLFSLAQSDRIRVFTDVPQVASIELKTGMPASVTAREYPKRAFEGTIARTSKAIDPGSKTLKVEVDIENKDGALLPGMYVKVSFKIPQPGLVQIPASALMMRPDGPQAAVVDNNNTVDFRNVIIGRDLGDLIEIQSGVTVGERVALNISSQVVQGQKVNAVESNEK